MQRPALFLFLGLAACGSDAPAPDEVRARIAKDLVTVATSAEASRAEGASLPDAAQFAVLGSAFSQLRSRIPTELVDEAEMPTMEDVFDGAAAAKWLNETLFTDANHAGDGIYTVPASLVCDGEDGLDADCAQAFAKIQLRIRVSEDDELLQFALQIGPDHDEPIEVGLSAKLLSLSVDLDEVEDAARAMLPKVGDDAPSFKLDGKLTAKLEVIAPAAARVSLAIDRGLWIRFADAGESLDGPTAFDISSKAAQVFELTLDGGVHSTQLRVGLGETHAKIPDEIDGLTEFHFPGLTANIAYREGEPLRIHELGLPAAVTLAVGGKEALRAELNPNDGRLFRGTVTAGLLEVFPRVDFRMHTDHALLGDEAPVYDVTRMFLEGGLRARPDDTLEVVGGALSLETSPASFGFSAVDGQCVRGSEAFDVATDASYTAWSVGACN